MKLQGLIDGEVKSINSAQAIWTLFLTELVKILR